MCVKGCLNSNFAIVFNTYVNLEFRNRYVYTTALKYICTRLMYTYIVVHQPNLRKMFGGTKPLLNLISSDAG